MSGRGAPHPAAARRTRPALVLALAGGLLALAPPPASAATAAAEGGTTGRLLVSVARPGEDATAGETDRRLDEVAAAAGGDVARQVEGGAGAAVRPADGTSVGALAGRLRKDPRVREVAVERRAAPRAVAPDEPALVQSDPEAAGVPAGWWVDRLRLPRAWDVEDGRGLRIAVIDTGVDTTHPQLAPVVEESVGDGVGTGSPGVDRTGHGTHVASLACAAYDDGKGVVGAGGDCRLITVRSDLSDSSVASSIDRARRLDADVLVMSFGTEPGTEAPRPIREALERAVDAGIVPVAAAADEPVRDQGYPANLLQPSGSDDRTTQGVGLSVTAADVDDRRAAFAGRGSQISVAGYGTYREGGLPSGILGAFPGRETELEAPRALGGGECGCRVTWLGDPNYAHLRGTSMATPMVAGVAGLVLKANEDLEAGEAAAIVRRSARRRDGRSDEIGWGVVDAEAAVERAKDTDVVAPVARLRTRSGTTRDARRTLFWSGSDRRSAEGVENSGVRTYQVWRRANGGSWRKLSEGRSPSRRVPLRLGRNELALRAFDRAGNHERVPTRAEIVLRRVR